MVIGGIGLLTTVDASLRSKIRADRKGALANATSATLGAIYMVLALGYPNVALLLSFGHTAFRVVQILRAPNLISDFQRFRSDLKGIPTPKMVPDWLFRLCWSLRRFTKDFNPVYSLNEVARHFLSSKPWKLNKLQQWAITGAAIVACGSPFTPYSHFLEHKIMELLPERPLFAASIMLAHFVVSVSLVKIVFTKVLTQKRFQRKLAPQKTNNDKNEN